MYGIRNRPAFVNYNYGMEGTREGASTLNPGTAKRYYSSLDAEIYFSDYYVDEIIHIQYSVTQNALPLFGYNSYVYDEVALGNRIIQGSFTINLTSPGYLFKLLDQIKKDENVFGNSQNINKPSEGTTDENGPATQMNRPGRGPLWDAAFDIDVMFGEENTLGKSVHVVLEGVVILGSSLQVDMTGTPIAENYTFIARDIRTID